MGPIGPMVTQTWRRLAREVLREASFSDAMFDRFPDGRVPWKWIEKVLDSHGVRLPLSGADAAEAEEYGLRPGQAASVDDVLRFLGY